MYMAEQVFFASGNRLPIVMAVVNRSISAPWNIWGDQSDSMAVRDSGWLQMYAESNQEALDATIRAYRIAEDPRITLPVMVCLDGFTLSHTVEGVQIPDQDQVTEFVGPNRIRVILDTEKPVGLSPLTPPELFTEYRFQHAMAVESSRGVIREVERDFSKRFGGGDQGLFVEYLTEDAEAVIVAMGTLATTARAVVNEFRSEGKRLGLIRMRWFRPFPSLELKKALGNIQAVGVIDKSFSIGNAGPLYTEISSALQAKNGGALVLSYIAGLGGRDVPLHHMRQIAKTTYGAAKSGKIHTNPFWVGLQ
jgi:pyruvate ferredoxin oxidoreductase alpha subunit